MVIRGALGEMLTALVIAAVLAVLIRVFVFSSLGVTLVAVEGHSMEPLFQSGDLVLVEHVDPKDVHVGDIIVYKGCNGRLIIHRVAFICQGDSVIGANQACFVTWGDNNPYPDSLQMTCSPTYCRIGSFLQPCVPYSRVLGKVVVFNGVIYKIPFIGGLASIHR